MEEKHNLRTTQSSLAMTIILISFGMLFASMLLAHVVLRFQVLTWPPMGFERVKFTLPLINSVVVILSSLTFWLFETKSYKTNAPAKSHLLFLNLTFLLGLIFLALQMLFWHQLKEGGVFASDGIYQSFIYAFTWVHAAHIIVGLGLLLYCIARVTILRFEFKDKVSKISSAEQNYKRTPAQLIINVGKFWHFLTIVWVVLFITLFVL